MLSEFFNKEAQITVQKMLRWYSLVLNTLDGVGIKLIINTPLNKICRVTKKLNRSILLATFQDNKVKTYLFKV